MDSLELSKKHERRWLPIEVVEDNPDNPNAMSNREFDLLVDNILQKGMTEDIEVRQIKVPSPKFPHGKYRVIGGHHRKKACKYLEWTEIPCIINNDPEMTDEKETQQLVRMNAIHGKIDPEKFVKIYEKLAEEHAEEVIQDMLGFADEKEFKKLIKSTADSLPPELKGDFLKAAKDIKTIDDLAKVLNTLLGEYGDTLEFGYMIFDFNGKQSIWLRMLDSQLATVTELGDWCRKNQRAMDDVVALLLSLTIIDGSDLQKKVLAETDEIDFSLPNHVSPTKDHIDAYEDL